jgi:uncharacterized protein DUF4129
MNRTAWIEDVFRPLVVGAMVACVAVSLADLARLFFPTWLFPAWKTLYIVAVCVFAALEAAYSYRLVQAQFISGNDLLRFRAIELVLFVVVLKITAYLGHNWVEITSDLQIWTRTTCTPLDLETGVMFFFAFLAWGATTETLSDLDRLNEPAEPPPRITSPTDSLTQRFFAGGALLLILTGFTRVGIAAIVDVRRPSVPGLAFNVLAYFMLGLVLLGQVHFTRLRLLWQEQQIPVAGNVAGRWARYSLVFLGLAALIALLLPTGYTYSLLDGIAAALTVISTVLTFIVLVVMWLLLLPFSWLWWLAMHLLGTPARPPATAPLPPPPPTQLLSPTTAQPPWFETLRILLVVSLVVGMIIYILRAYLRDHPDVLKTLSALRPIRGLRRWWTVLWRRLGGWADVLNERLPREWLRRWMRPPPLASPLRFFRLGAQSPRDQILYFYLSLLRRAGRLGFPRRPAQTPHEYEPTLAAHLPEAQAEADQLTQAFVEARYSRQAMGVDQARRVRAYWGRLRAALQARRQGG